MELHLLLYRRTSVSEPPANPHQTARMFSTIRRCRHRRIRCALMTSRLDARMLTRCSTVCSTATTKQATTSTRVAARSPRDGVHDRGHHDEDGQLDRLDDPVELQRRGDPRASAQSRATGTARPPPRSRATRPARARATSTRSVSALIRMAPSAAATPSTVVASRAAISERPEAQPDQQGGLGEVVADPVEVDAGERGLLGPAGELAVGAVEQQVELDQQGRAERRAQSPGTQQRRRRPARPQTIIRQVSWLGVIGVSTRKPGDVERQLAHVERARPVLAAAPLLGARRAGRPRRSSATDGLDIVRVPVADLGRRTGRGAPGSCTGRDGSAGA